MELGRTPRDRVLRATAAVLPEGLTVDVRTMPTAAPITFEVSVKAGSFHHRFLAGWASDGWPADVERLLAAAPSVDVVVARHLSEGAKTKLAERRIGWVDEAGQAQLSLRSGLVVLREPLPPERPSATNDRWTPTMLAAAEAIFAGTPPTVEAVEAVTGMSRGAATKALARFEQRGHLGRPGAKRGPGAARRVVDIDAFIDDYAEAAQGFRAQQRPLRIHRLMADPLDVLATDIGPNLSAIGATWAVSGAAASILLAPYLSDVRILDLYVDAAHLNQRIALVVGGRQVSKGHVIEIRELPTPMSAKGARVQGVNVALPARVYADLVAVGGRFEEAAQHLREVRGIGPDAK